MEAPQAVQPATDAPGGVATPQGGDPTHVYRPTGDSAACLLCGGRRLASLHAVCGWDSCAPLIHPQKRFAKDACRAAWHDSLHPRINPPGLGLRASGSIKERIRRHLLSLEGRHATTYEIAAAIQEHEHTTARELRKLRQRGCPVQEMPLHGPKKPSVFWIQKGAA